MKSAIRNQKSAITTTPGLDMQLARLNREIANNQKLIKQAKTYISRMEDILSATIPEGRTCIHCGCTELHGCEGGCHWLEIHPATYTGVCSSCAHHVPKRIMKNIRFAVTSFFPMCDGSNLTADQLRALGRWIHQAIQTNSPQS